MAAQIYQGVRTILTEISIISACTFFNKAGDCCCGAIYRKTNRFFFLLVRQIDLFFDIQSQPRTQSAFDLL